MKNTFKHLVIAALFSVVLPAQAAVQTYNFNGVLGSGVYMNEVYSGSFSFDDASVDNAGLDIVNLLSFDMSILNTNFSLVNATDFPTILPEVSFQDGSFLGLSLSIDSVTPDIGFTFNAGSYDVSDSHVSYINSLGNEGEGGITYSLTVPVPEADTYAMLLAGLGVMGAVARRRKTA